MQKDKISRGIVAFIIGCVIIHFADRILGVRIELFYGLSTFSVLWFLDMFIVPFLAGIVVAYIYGLGGKWLCYFPPFLVKAVGYYEMVYLLEIPPGTSLIPLGWWGFFVILVIESAAIGGILGEVWAKRGYNQQRSTENLAGKDQ